MLKSKYTDEQLLKLGQTNYDKLALYCQTLETSGFWDKARQVMQQSSTEVLDMYVQSVLMELAIHCGNVLDSQVEFIQTVPITNPFALSKETEIDDDLQKDMDRMCSLPPILIQLCSLYDKEKGEDITEYFLDGLLNVLLCMAYLNTGKDAKINEFIQKYYNKISHYVDGKTPMEHSRYIFGKLSDDEIKCNIEKKEEKSSKKLAKEREGMGPLAIASAIEVGGKKGESNDSTDVELNAKDTEKVTKKETIDQVQNDTTQDQGRVDVDNESVVDITQQPIEDSGIDIIADSDDTIKEEADNVLLDDEKEEELSSQEQAHEITKQAKEQFLQVKKRIMEREKEEREAQEKRIQDLLDELNGLVGLDNVKEEIQSLINLIKIRKLRQKMNLPEMDMSYHMVFTGSPGTGKTTVARLVARIYKELGILSEGKVIETDRSGLVAGYVGQTAIKVHDIVEEALGGILFIDEAYSLVNPDVPNDFGGEAVDALVKLMEDHRDNLVVIVAGYTEEMKTFLKSNTGLISRFNKFIEFKDYSKKELVDILDVMTQNAGLEIEASAKKRVLNILYKKKDEEWRDFGNARGIRNVFEKIVMNQANRLVTLENPQKEDLIMLKREDVVV